MNKAIVSALLLAVPALFVLGRNMLTQTDQNRRVQQEVRRLHRVGPAQRHVALAQTGGVQPVRDAGVGMGDDVPDVPVRVVIDRAGVGAGVAGTDGPGTVGGVASAGSSPGPASGTTAARRAWARSCSAARSRWRRGLVAGGVVSALGGGASLAGVSG